MIMTLALMINREEALYRQRFGIQHIAFTEHGFPARIWAGVLSKGCINTLGMCG